MAGIGMICAHCSTPVADEARFCHSCGSLVSDAEGQAAATAAMDQSSFAHMERLLREDTKGVYTVKHMLGRGGMAVVYLAEETGLARKVALKVLPPELTFGHGVERFKREARTAAALDHPHIIPIYRIGDSGKLFWYAMKFLEGKSLEDLLKERGSLTVEETVEILEQVADALDYAHDHKVIHRDIKPANVMLDNRNRVIVTDFGIAKALSEGKLTATDSVIGTPYFMSPEQGMGKPVSGAADQYSVAVMAYRMLAGHVPFDGDSAIDILHKHCMFPAPSLHDDVPEIPEHVANAVGRALAKNADERFVNVTEFVKSIADENFNARGPARPSVATVVMTPDEAKKLRTKAGGTKPGTSGGGSVSRSGAKSTAAHEDRTVVAGQKPVTRPAAAPAPAPKSKTGLYAAIAVLAIAGAGGGYVALKGNNQPTQTAQVPPTGPSATPPNPGTDPGAGTATDPNAAANAAGSTGAGNPPAGTNPAPNTANPATNPPANTPTDTKATGTKNPAPRQQQTATKTPPRSNPAPTQAAPVQTAQTPAAQDPAPVAAVETGKLNILISPPGLLEIDGVPQGEKSRAQIDLSKGTHLVTVKKDGYRTITQSVDITPGTPTTLRLTLEPRP